MPSNSNLGRKRVLKRSFDLFSAMLLLVILSPILLILFILVWVFMGWPVIFSQSRPGLHGKIFNLYKFRTMRSSNTLGGRPLPDEVRLTGLGRFMRSFSLDELPELCNVLRGEMSLVGPRPLLIAYLERYTSEQSRRHDVPPGITGWAQVNGRNALPWEEKFKLDLWYVEHGTFALDLKILILTAWKVFKRESINAPGNRTPPEFMGDATPQNHPRD